MNVLLVEVFCVETAVELRRVGLDPSGFKVRRQCRSSAYGGRDGRSVVVIYDGDISLTASC